MCSCLWGDLEKQSCHVQQGKKNKEDPPEGLAGAARLPTTCVILTAHAMQIYIAILIDDRYEHATKATYHCRDQ